MTESSVTSHATTYQNVNTTTAGSSDSAPTRSVTASSHNEQHDCLCACSSVGSNAALNITTEEVMEKLKDIINDIKVDAKTTSLAKNKLVSAKDGRPSAKAVGYLGIALVVSVGASIVIIDIDILIRFLKNKWISRHQM